MKLHLLVKKKKNLYEKDQWILSFQLSLILFYIFEVLYCIFELLYNIYRHIFNFLSPLFLDFFGYFLLIIPFAIVKHQNFVAILCGP